MIILVTKLLHRVRIQKFIEVLTENVIEHQILYQEKRFKSKIISHLNWMFVLISYIFKNRRINSGSTYHLVGFEVALIFIILGMNKNNKIIFDNTDNFSASKNFKFGIKKVVIYLEDKIIKKSTVHVVPDQCRLDNYRYKENAVILHNTPTSSSFNDAVTIVSLVERNKKFRIYINGWLPETRGKKLIFDFIKSHKDDDIEFVIATANFFDEDLPNTTQIGIVSYTQSLAEYLNADMVFTLYDPKIPINIIATPNKWNDAILTKTIPIINEEIITINQYFPFGGFLSIRYNNYDDLDKQIFKYTNDIEYREALKTDISKNPIVFFNEKYLEILKEHFL